MYSHILWLPKDSQSLLYYIPLSQEQKHFSAPPFCSCFAIFSHHHSFLPLLYIFFFLQTTSHLCTLSHSYFPLFKKKKQNKKNLRNSINVLKQLVKYCLQKCNDVRDEFSNDQPKTRLKFCKTI